MTFHDHFSHLAADYAAYRPSYPPELFAYLASLVPEHDLAWDVATGSGQAARGLTPHFQRIIATDGSEQQIAHAARHPKIEYRVTQNDDAKLEIASVDLITVAQALHWFASDRFYAEVRRVAKPHAIIAAWFYASTLSEPSISALHEYYQLVAPYWPPERKHIEENYRSLLFPFRELSAPEFHCSIQWTLDQLLGYVRSWSATQRYRQTVGEDPVERFTDLFAETWDDPQRPQEFTFPLFLKIGRVA